MNIMHTWKAIMAKSVLWKECSMSEDEIGKKPTDKAVWAHE